MRKQCIPGPLSGGRGLGTRLLRLLVGEAQRRGGLGWLEYDRQFRAQAAANPAKAWSKLDLSLFSNSFLAEKYRPARAPPSCEYCLEADHATEDCALAPTSEVVYRKSKQRKQQYCKLFNFGKDGCSYGAGCVFMHCCSKCGMEGHKASACKSAAPARAQ